MNDKIRVRGARVNNLKNIDVDISCDSITVVTGLSGSGKSSLVFDTIYAEGRRKYFESLSFYARQFLGDSIKPDVDKVEGIRPVIAIDQKFPFKNPRSTLGTITEIYDLIRVFFAKLGRQYCPFCNVPVNKNICPNCGRDFPPITPGFFSFNNPEGACPVCTGLGKEMYALTELIIPNDSLTIAEGGIAPWRKMGIGDKILRNLADVYNFSLDAPIKDLPKGALKVILYGEDIPGGFEGVLNDIGKRYRQAASDFLRNELEEYLIERNCEACKSKRLNPPALSVFIGRRNIDDVVNMPISKMGGFLEMDFQFTDEEKKIASVLIGEIILKVETLKKLGLGYLSLSRSSTALSGGEIQRARLARQLGAGLSGLLYVLDEPTIGLHQRDVGLIISALKQLKKDGNTILAVEHDKQIMQESDYLIDIGYGAGEDGGRIVAQGTPGAVSKKKTFTGLYLSGESVLNINTDPKGANLERKIIIKGAEENNLKNISVEIPLGRFVCVSGVSGSGKSSLIEDILAKSLLKKLYRAKDDPGKHKSIEGIDSIKRVVNVDQSPIGRTPRSNPATYTGVFTHIRDVFVNSEDAKIKGLKPGHFSFNVKGGRCEACQGEGEKKIEMHFLQDMYVKCEACGGKRYLPEILNIKYKGLNISDVLSMNIREACPFFLEHEKIKEKLDLLSEVGLGYLKLGQSAMNLSGGEAQRIKLAAELSKRSSEETLYILDEPTIGLHFEDVKKLLRLLLKLVEKGSSVIVIEHNIDVLKNADWIIDLGPEGGDGGGEIVAQGTPEDIIKAERSVTGKFLK